MNRREARQCLTGPIPSICTPFLSDGSVDYAGLRNIVAFCIDAGTSTLLLTAGDSHYLCLSDEEILEVTRVTCRQAAGRASVIAADRFHATGRAVEFAKQVRPLGAAMMMCMPPDWAGSCTPRTLAEHYAAVATVLPVMIVTNVFIPRGADFGLETVRRSMEASKNIVAVKDDMCGDFARKLCLLAGGELAIIAGGQKINHMNMWPYGVDGYLSTFLSFKPEIARRYWKAIEADDIPAARQIIREYDVPLFDYLLPHRGGFDAPMHGIYELFGLCGRWRRPPYCSATDEEMERLRGFLTDRKLL